MNRDVEYTDMKEMISRSRKGLSLLTEEVVQNPGIMGNKDSELQSKALDNDNTDTKISLDDNKEATIITDGQETDERIKTGLQSVLNGYVEAVRGSITNIDRITVKVGDTAMVITMMIMMSDNQPATVTINSESKSVQLKYDNFLELSKRNVDMIMRTYTYFVGNEKLMSQLQGAISIS